MEKISVIIPMYNVEKKLLDRCIDSVLKQTYKNIEIILIDDGSKENFKRYYQKYYNQKSIEIIVQKNQGASSARNNGIKKSTGDWIIFVDADDYLEKDACELLIEKVNDIEDIDVIISKAYFNNEGKKIGTKNYYKEDKVIETFKDKEELLCSILQSKNKYTYVDSPWAKMYRTEFIKSNKIKFNKKLKVSEDGLFNYEAYSLANKILYVDDFTYNYVYYNDSACHKYKDTWENDLNDCLEEFEKKFTEKGIINLDYAYNCFGLWKFFKIVLLQICNKGNKEKYRVRKGMFKRLKNHSRYTKFLKNVKLRDLSNMLKVIYILLKYAPFRVIDITIKML